MVQAELFRKDFEKNGGQIVALETYKTGETDFKATFAKIKKAAPDVVFLPGYYVDVARQLPQARKAGLKVPFLGSDNWGVTALLLKSAGPDAEGAFYCSHYHPGARNMATAVFVANYKARYADATPDDIAALTYDSLGLLVTALKSAGKPDRQAVRDALAKITEYDGVTGKLRFIGGSHDPVKSAGMMKIEGGKPLWVTNIDPDVN
jgi:branched-chain amino acid transport system substrate-binding protein